MGSALAQRSSVAAEYFDRAADVLGYDLRTICFEGPAEKLDSTEFAQPALFVTSIAAAETLRSEKPGVFDNVMGAAGLSLGEYTAVTFAGALDFDEALSLVQRRGQAMQAAADAVESAMASVLGIPADQLAALCDEVREEGEVLQLANLLCPGNIAVSGHRTAIERLEPRALEAGAMKVVRLAVAGAFHTELMAPAVQQLREALAEMPLRPAEISVYSNVDARPHREPEEIRDLLARQVVSPVLWEDSLRAMIDDGAEQFLELGSGRVLRGTLKRVDRKMPAEGYGDE